MRNFHLKRLRFNLRHWPLASRLTLFMTLLVIITLSAATFVTIRAVQATLTAQIGENFKTHAESLNNLIGVFFLEEATQLQALAVSENIIKAVANRNATYSGKPTEILTKIEALDTAWKTAADDDPLVADIIAYDHAINPAAYQLANFPKTFKDHSQLLVTDRYGAIVAATSRMSDYYYADETWWQAAWNDGQGAVYLSEQVTPDSSGMPTMLLTVPIYSSHSGELIGLMRSTLILDKLFDLMANLKLGRTGHITLFDGAGDVIFSSLTKPGELSQVKLNPKLRNLFIEEVSSFETGLDADGTELLFGHAVFQGDHFKIKATSLEIQVVAALVNLGWSTVVQQDAEEAFAIVGVIAQNSLITGLIAVLLAGLGAMFIARTITRPLITLSKAAIKIGMGNLDTPLPPANDDEVGRLAVSFENMVIRLRQSFDGLILARDRALEASRLKSELLARVSHELRTPLGAIMGFAELLEMGRYGPLSDKQQDSIAEISDSAKGLMNMINDLLAEAQLEAGTLQLDIAPFPPADLNRDVLPKMRVLAEAKGLTLTGAIAHDMPPTLLGDQPRLRQILFNLIGNAIKFTEQGTVYMHIYQHDTTHWAIQVTDTGLGILAEARAYIFEPFRQVDGSATREHVGSGLGLSIVKQLVTLMGGQITLSSQVGHGSTFTIILPLDPPQEKSK